MNHLGGHLNITHVDDGVLKAMQEKFNCKSMLDVGCGPAGQLEVAKNLGFEKVLGLDGDPAVAKEGVVTIDFTKDKFDSDDRYDLGWSCEFVEHVKEEYIPNFMSAFKACKYVCLTHAPPNTLGHHHVNCQTKEYWVKVFKGYGFEFLEEESSQCREASTMKRNFFRENGLVFKNINNV